METAQIVGVDMLHPDVATMRGRFRRHTVTPEKAAQAILEGVRQREPIRNKVESI